MRFARFTLLAASAFGLSLFACATGGSVQSTYMSGGTGGSGGASSSSHSSSHAATSSSAVSSSGESSSSGAGGSGGSSSSSSGAGGACSYAAPETCDTAELLMAIDGDQNMDTRVESGTTSKWYKIYIHEGVSSIISYPPLSYTATLENPAGMHFDLYSYRGDVSNPNCQVNPLEGVGDPLSISEQWGDNKGTDDSTWYVFEVRYVSGTVCDPSSKWKLTIAGHTMP